MERTPFVGREAEMAELTPLLDRLAEGRGAFVLLAGEPGVGKTRLARELAAKAAARGVLAVTGSSYEVQGATPYAPLVEALQAATRAISAERPSAAGSAAPAVARLLPDSQLASTDVSLPLKLPAEQERPYLFNQLREFLERLATTQPLILVLEDLHWADESTTLLLVQMARWLDEMPVVVLATYREAELGPNHPFARALETLIRERLARQLTLKSLARDGVAMMLGALSGTAPPPAIVDAVHHRTEGNPFFIEELFKHVAEEGRLFAEPGSWRADADAADLGVPERVRLVIERRLRRLNENTRSVLTLAAVIGPAFSYKLLEALRTVEGEELLNAIDEAECARLIVPAPDARDARYTFAHVLIQETLLSGVSVPRRQRLHLRVVGAIEEVHGEALEARVPELAHQLYAAGSAADPLKTVHHLYLAGKWAVAATGYEEGATSFRRALEILELAECADDARRCEMLLALGDAEWRAGRVEACERATLTAAAIAKELGAAALLARAASIMAQGWGWTASGPLIRLLEEALDALGDEDSPLKGTLLARLARELAVRAYLGVADVADRSARAVALSEESVIVARRSGDARSLAWALEARSLATWGPESAEQRRAAADEIVRLASEAGDWAIARMGHEQRFAACLELGDVRQADADADEIDRFSKEVNEPMALASARLYRVTQALRDGKLDDVERGLRALRTISRGLRPVEGGRLMFAAQMFLLRREQGRSGELLTAGAVNVERYPALAAGLAAIHFDVGREDEARRQFEALAAHEFRDIARGPLWMYTMALLAELCAALADAPRAAAIRCLLLPHAGRYVVVNWGQGFIGPVAHYLALLTTSMHLWDEAEHHFEQALEMGLRIEARPWVAHTQCEYGRMLLLRHGRRDRRKGLNLLAEARGTAGQLGMRRLDARIDGVLRTHRATSAYPDALTQREVEVLRLIAAGRSSREAGADLCLSTRTVERHITNLYTKIGAHNRAQAAAYALAHHLAEPSPVLRNDEPA